MQRTVKAAWTPPSFLQVQTTAQLAWPVPATDLISECLQNTASVLTTWLWDWVKRPGSNKVSFFDSRPGSNIWDLGLPSEPHSLWELSARGSRSLQEATAWSGRRVLAAQECSLGPVPWLIWLFPVCVWKNGITCLRQITRCLFS